MCHHQPISSTDHGQRGGDRPWYWQRRPPVSPLNELNNNIWKWFYFILTITLSLSTINIQSWWCNKIILGQHIVSPDDTHKSCNTDIISQWRRSRTIFWATSWLIELIRQELINTAAAAMHGRWRWSIDHRHLMLLVFVVVVHCDLCIPLGR